MKNKPPEQTSEAITENRYKQVEIVEKYLKDSNMENLSIDEVNTFIVKTLLAAAERIAETRKRPSASKISQETKELMQKRRELANGGKMQYMYGKK